jgi:hypothetical protein
MMIATSADIPRRHCIICWTAPAEPGQRRCAECHASRAAQPTPPAEDSPVGFPTVPQPLK